MICIGDVHGEYDSLMRLIDCLPSDDNLCFVGDLIDRGERSKDVVSFVKDNGYKCVLGNHEDFMVRSCLDFCHQDDDWFYVWIDNGGGNTLKSYSLSGNFNYNLFLEHKEWMDHLPLVINYNEKIMISHGRCLPFLDNIQKYDVIWYKNRKKDHNYEGLLNIHGHQTIYDLKIQDCYLNLDTGCHSYGILTAYDIESQIVYRYDKERGISEFELPHNLF